MNLLVTLDSGYLHQLGVMLSSLVHSNPEERFDVYVLHSSLTEEELRPIRQLLGENRLLPIQVQDPSLEDAPTTGRYPVEMYYRIFAARYLPKNLSRILYLDPDLIVKGPIRPLYETPLGDHPFAAASHVQKMVTRINTFRLDMAENSAYINSGILLLNLEQLRRSQQPQQVYDYIEAHKNRLILPDQDVLSALYGSQVLPLDPYRYNLTERLFALRPQAEVWLDLDWVRKNTVIVHYCGRNKPWKPGYVGALGGFYKEAEAAWQS